MTQPQPLPPPYTSTLPTKNPPVWLRPGPWQTEPQAASWLHPETGYVCQMLRHGRYGHWMGYVGVPKEHPLYGLAYSSQVPEPPGFMNSEIDRSFGGFEKLNLMLSPADRKLFDLSIFLVSHDGVTFACKGEDNDLWWFGFDCNHSGDWTPKKAQDPFYKECAQSFTYRTFDYVQGTVNRLADSLRTYGEFYALWKMENPADEWHCINADPPPQDRPVFFYAPGTSQNLPDLYGSVQWHPEGGWCVDEVRNITHWRPCLPPKAEPSNV